ncbi:hypothetical protein D9M73_215710 [compost metagenome]
MRRQFGLHVDRAAIGMVDANAPGMQVHFPRDIAGQERRLPAIFAVADDRVADRREMHAELVGAPGIGDQLQPRRGGARHLDHAVARARRAAFFLIDMHLLAAGAGLLGDRQFDHPVLDRRHADDQRPIGFPRGA